MKLTKCLKHAFNLVVHSRIRSWLTILGIVIGVAAVIAIMSLGEGMRQSIGSQLGALGGDILTITPGYSRGGGFFGQGRTGGAAVATKEQPVLSRSDYQALRSIPEVLLIDTNIRGNVDVSYLGKKGSVSLTGVDQKVWSQITTSKIRSGRMLDSADQNVILVGGRLADSYFDKPLGINQMISIENSAFRIVGILDDSSTNIYMPIQMAFQVLDSKTNGEYDSLIVKIKDETALDDTIAKIEKRLMLVRHVTSSNKDFTISSNRQIQTQRNEMMTSINAFLLAIAAVSLIVGAIGIANTMFTSVLEKTKEIGIMKAIGAKNRDILVIFLLNAVLIGLVGGIIGVVFGIFLSGALPALIGQSMLTRGGTLVSPNSILISLSVSILVGLLAGAIPAYQGSKLKPVDALRYE